MTNGLSVLKVTLSLRPEVFNTANILFAVLCVVTPCVLVDAYYCYREFILKKEAA